MTEVIIQATELAKEPELHTPEAIAHWAERADKTQKVDDIVHLQEAIRLNFIGALVGEYDINQYLSLWDRLDSLTWAAEEKVRKNFGGAITVSKDKKVNVDPQHPEFQYGYNDGVKNVARELAIGLIGKKEYENTLRQASFYHAIHMVASILKTDEVAFSEKFVGIVCGALSKDGAADAVLNVVRETGDNFSYLGDDNVVKASLALQQQNEENTGLYNCPSRNNEVNRLDLIARSANLAYMFSQIYRDLTEAGWSRTNGSKKENFNTFNIMVQRKFMAGLRLGIDELNLDPAITAVLEGNDFVAAMKALSENHPHLNDGPKKALNQNIANGIIRAAFEIWKDILTQKQINQKKYSTMPITPRDFLDKFINAAKNVSLHVME